MLSALVFALLPSGALVAGSRVSADVSAAGSAGVLVVNEQGQPAASSEDVSELIEAYDAIGWGRCCCLRSRNACWLFPGHSGQCQRLSRDRLAPLGLGRVRLRHYTDLAARGRGRCLVHDSRAAAEARAVVNAALAPFLDVSEFAAAYEAQGLECCCLGARGDPDWVGHCGLFPLSSRRQCAASKTARDLPGAGSSVRPTPLTHYANQGGKCLLTREEADEEVERAMREFGSLPGYCQPSQGDDWAVRASLELGQTADVECEVGKKEEEPVMCAFQSTMEGVFVPEPTCIIDPEHCQAISEDPVTVNFAALGEVRTVSCLPGYEPDAARVGCQADGSFFPMPNCRKIRNYCGNHQTQPQGQFGRATVESAEVDDERPVLCDLGWEPIIETTVCNESRSFDPPPTCVKMEDFCPDVLARASNGGATAPPSVIESASPVTCGQDQVPGPPEVTCRADGRRDEGSFFPAPRCHMDCTVAATLISGHCSGRSLGACYTAVGDTKEWECWTDEVTAAQRTDEICETRGFDGACNFVGYGQAATEVEPELCSTLPSYAGECNSGWGACYVDGGQHWACIDDAERFHPNDCKTWPLPTTLARSMRRRTYSGACRT